jgi:type IV pilus assembly protein PilC
MSTYAYLCLDVRGAELRGTTDAPDETAARRQLRDQGLKVLDLAEGTIGGDGLWAALKNIGREFSRIRSVSDGDRVLFYRQMHLMLNAGHTLLEALSAAAVLTSRARLADVLGRISAGIQRGSSLSVACSGEKELFDRLALKMLEAGEVSGELGLVFERLAGLVERRREVRVQLLNALMYPVIILLMTLLVGAVMVFWTMPNFKNFLATRGRALPWDAQMLLDASDWLAQWGGYILLGMLLFAVAVALSRKLAKPRRIIDAIVLRLPVVGKTLVLAAMTQITWVFSVLIKSRLTVLEALRVCKDVSGNASFVDALTRTEENVLAGRTLAVALDQSVLPRLVRHMAAVGERSGQLDAVMEDLGTHYRKALDARVKLLLGMVEPVLILVCGGMVATVYIVFFRLVFISSFGGN